jgi:hypothetical protein
MKHTLALFLILCSYRAFLVKSQATESKPARSNVLLFLADDESWQERSA